ncbi:hypothetical protein G7Y89_g14203 [Cudoniella acicularis]|uniref:14-3-3 domain-containing protein n=1 Tax=Cudoniella acicularis TaxID=354080 RepID=A0A8H4R4M2_9HELO|nr:hypothetical protein G7Y89_g14203 [Cudoniella acicularis]
MQGPRVKVVIPAFTPPIQRAAIGRPAFENDGIEQAGVAWAASQRGEARFSPPPADAAAAVGHFPSQTVFSCIKTSSSCERSADDGVAARSRGRAEDIIRPDTSVTSELGDFGIGQGSGWIGELGRKQEDDKVQKGLLAPCRKFLKAINKYAPNQDLSLSMASSEVDMKFLAQFASNIQVDHPFLAKNLFQILGNLTMLSDKVIRARKLRRLDTTRDTKSVDLYCRIIWYAREGLKLLEEYVLPMVANFGELKVLSYKLRASYYHLYVLFHNDPPVTFKSSTQVSTPPGLKSPRATKVDKGKAPDRGSPDIFRPSSVQPTHPLEGGPVGGITLAPPPEFAPNFLVPAADYRPLAMRSFQEASALAEKLLWGSHPLRLSVRVEYSAFLYDCLHQRDSSRQLAKATITEVYNAQEGMDDDMFEDAASLVGILGKMMKRGLGSASQSGSTPGGSATRTTPPRQAQYAVPSPGMDNAI